MVEGAEVLVLADGGGIGEDGSWHLQTEAEPKGGPR